MDKQTENMDFFFERLREQSAMSVAELEKIVASRKESEAKRPFVLWGAAGMLALVMGSGVLLMQEENATTISSSQTVASAPVQSATATQETSSPEMSAASTSRNTVKDPDQSWSEQRELFTATKLRQKNMGPIPRMANIDINTTSPTLNAAGTVRSNDVVETIDFGGNKLIELTKEELAGIGVRVTQDGRVECNWQYGLSGRDKLSGRIFKSGTLSADSL